MSAMELDQIYETIDSETQKQYCNLQNVISKKESSYETLKQKEQQPYNRDHRKEIKTDTKTSPRKSCAIKIIAAMSVLSLLLATVALVGVVVILVQDPLSTTFEVLSYHCPVSTKLFSMS